MPLLFLESLGTTELLVILVMALVLFGPRKLPELARSFGKGLSEFKRASDDFKRTWEREVALESVEREAAISRAMVPDIQPAQFPPDERAGTTASPADASAATDFETEAQGVSIARGSQVAAAPMPIAPGEAEAAEETSSRKSDWL